MRIVGSALYDRGFYERRFTDTARSAQVVAETLATILPRADSVIDFGCGVGAWLKVFQDRGANKVVGLDGDWVEEDLLVIKPDEFVRWNLSQPYPVEERFDLAISLEVAEHVPMSSAKTFVGNLVASSNFVLFSAAIPGQGGIGHINEQWQSFWASLFADRGFVPFDVVRPKIWSMDDVPFPYKQNTILYVEAGSVDQLRGGVSETGQESLALVHPELYNAVRSNSIRKASKLLLAAILQKVQR